MNVVSMDISGVSLETRPIYSLITASEEDRVIAAMSTLEIGPVLMKEVLAKRGALALIPHIEHSQQRCSRGSDTLTESIEECLGGRWSSGVPSGIQEFANDDGG